MSKPTKGKNEIAQVGTISANGDDDDRRDHRRGDGEGRQGRRHHRRRGQVDGDDARRRRGHAVRPRLPLAVLRDRPRAHGGRARGRVHPHPREEDLEHEGPAAGARAGGQERQAAAIIAEDVDGEALATLVVNKLRGTLQVVRGQGAGLRRSPQGDAQGHRRPHRRPGDHRGPRPQAREPHAQGPRPRQAHHDRQGQHHHRRRRRQEGRHRGAREADPRADRGHHLATTTARSSRSGWPSSSAASR